MNHELVGKTIEGDPHGGASGYDDEAGDEPDPHDSISGECHVTEVSLARIVKVSFDNDRHNPDTLAPLMTSVEAFGQVNPAVIRRMDRDQYVLICGRRRYWALQHLYRKHPKQHRFSVLRAVVLSGKNPDTGVASLQLPDNLHRDAPGPYDIAAWLQERMDKKGLTHEQLGRELGRSRSSVTQLLSINGLSAEVRALANRKASRLTTGFLIELVQLGDSDEAAAILNTFQDGAASRTGLKDAKKPHSGTGRHEAAKALAAARRLVKHVDRAIKAASEESRPALVSLSEQLNLVHSSLTTAGLNVPVEAKMLQRGQGDGLGLGTEMSS